MSSPSSHFLSPSVRQWRPSSISQPATEALLKHAIIDAVAHAKSTPPDHSDFQNLCIPWKEKWHTLAARLHAAKAEVYTAGVPLSCNLDPDGHIPKAEAIYEQWCLLPS